MYGTHCILASFPIFPCLTLTINHTFVFTGDEETPAFIRRNTASGIYCSGLIYSTWRSPRAPREQPLTYLYKLQSRRHSFIQRRRKLHTFSTTKLRWSDKRSAAMKTTLTTKTKATFSKSSVNHMVVIYRHYSRGPDQSWHFYDTLCLHTC